MILNTNSNGEWISLVSATGSKFTIAHTKTTLEDIKLWMSNTIAGWQTEKIVPKYNTADTSKKNSVRSKRLS